MSCIQTFEAWTRRDFIRRSLYGATAAATLPGFLNNTLMSMDARPSAVSTAADGGPILVIMQLGGGNDSLNTVIPYENSIYFEARPNLSLRLEDGILPLGDAPAMLDLQSSTTGTAPVGFHPAFAKMHDLWLDGDVAVLNGVGYPNPNLSHFTSFDYWHTARPNEASPDGWLGRFFDHQCSGCEPTTAVQLNKSPSLALRSQTSAASVTFRDPETYGWRELSGSDPEQALEGLYRQLVGLDHPTDSGIDAQHDTLAYVQRTAHNALVSSRDVDRAIANAGASGSGFPSTEFPDTGLGDSFRNIAAMIHGGMSTSIYYAHQGGYDTHNNQVAENTSGQLSALYGRQANLLRQLDDALGAFADEMKAQGNWNRTCILVFSEFGRKVNENGSAGTDHGAAETLFALGGGVNGSFYGLLPDLAEESRIKNNSLVYNIDFRSVYRTVLQNWLGVPDSLIGDILPTGNPTLLPFLNRF